MEAGIAQTKNTIAFISDRSPVINVIVKNLSVSGYKILFHSESIGEGMAKLSGLKVLPDVCIIDLDFQDKIIMAQFRELKETQPEAKIIIHSVIDTEETVRTLLSLGTDGYLLVGSNTDDFQNAIRTVSNDKKYFSMGVIATVQKYFDHK